MRPREEVTWRGEAPRLQGVGERPTVRVPDEPGLFTVPHKAARNMSECQGHVGWLYPPMTAAQLMSLGAEEPAG